MNRYKNNISVFTIYYTRLVWNIHIGIYLYSKKNMEDVVALCLGRRLFCDPDRARPDRARPDQSFAVSIHVLLIPGPGFLDMGLDGELICPSSGGEGGGRGWVTQ